MHRVRKTLKTFKKILYPWHEYCTRGRPRHLNAIINTTHYRVAAQCSRDIIVLSSYNIIVIISFFPIILSCTVLRSLLIVLII